MPAVDWEARARAVESLPAERVTWRAVCELLDWRRRYPKEFGLQAQPPYTYDRRALAAALRRHGEQVRHVQQRVWQHNGEQQSRRALADTLYEWLHTWGHSWVSRRDWEAEGRTARQWSRVTRRMWEQDVPYERKFDGQRLLVRLTVAARGWVESQTP